MECTCPLIEANVDYMSFGGLQSPCNDLTRLFLWKEATLSMAGPVLAQHAMNSATVALAWEVVAPEFENGGPDGENTVSNDEIDIN